MGALPSSAVFLHFQPGGNRWVLVNKSAKFSAKSRGIKPFANLVTLLKSGDVDASVNTLTLLNSMIGMRNSCATATVLICALQTMLPRRSRPTSSSISSAIWASRTSLLYVSRRALHSLSLLIDRSCFRVAPTARQSGKRSLRSSRPTCTPAPSLIRSPCPATPPMSIR